MADQKGKNIPKKRDFDDNSRERISRSCLGQICIRSVIEILSHFFLILLIIFPCFWKNCLLKTLDQSTVAV